MLDIENLTNEEIIEKISNPGDNFKNFWLDQLIKEFFSRKLYKELNLERLKPSIILEIIERFNSDYLDYLNDDDLHLFILSLLKFVSDHYKKLLSLDMSLSYEIINSLKFLNIDIKDKIRLYLDLYGCDSWESSFVNYLLKNVDNWNEILDLINQYGDNCIINLFKDLSFNLDDKQISQLDDKYLFLYSFFRKRKLFSDEKNYQFLKFILSLPIDKEKLKDLIFDRKIEIDDTNILLIFEIIFNSRYFLNFENFFNFIPLKILKNKILEIADLSINYLAKPESISLDKSQIKKFINELLVYLLERKAYTAVIKLILKLYNSKLQFKPDDIFIFDNKLIFGLLASDEMGVLNVKDFEKIILFFMYFRLSCSDLVDLRFKNLYNRFVIYRLLKYLYKNKVDCNYGYRFTNFLRKNYSPFSTSLVFYFIYFVYLKFVSKKL